MIDRIESLKAGTISALSLTIVYMAIAIAHHLPLAKPIHLWQDGQTETIEHLLIKIAIAILSGFLFGVTYRYIIRDDDNPHLKSGAVLAFGLVRGLASIEGEANFPQEYWLLGIWVIESMTCFAIARFTLDWAISHHWLKPFTSKPESSPPKNPSPAPPHH